MMANFRCNLTSNKFEENQNYFGSKKMIGWEWKWHILIVPLSAVACGKLNSQGQEIRSKVSFSFAVIQMTLGKENGLKLINCFGWTEIVVAPPFDWSIISGRFWLCASYSMLVYTNDRISFSALVTISTIT